MPGTLNIFQTNKLLLPERHMLLIDIAHLILQVNVVNYKTRPNAKDFIQVEIVVEKNSQKIILIGKVKSKLFLLWYLLFYFYSFWGSNSSTGL